MTLFALLALSAFAASPVDPFNEPDESELYRAEERVVTVASRYAQTVAQAPNIVTVLTDREIASTSGVSHPVRPAALEMTGRVRDHRKKAAVWRGSGRGVARQQQVPAAD